MANLLWAIVFVMLVQVRHADGTPLVGLRVQALQGRTVAAECVTDAAGQCELAVALNDSGEDPILQLDGYEFGPYGGADGGLPIFVLWPELLRAGRVGLVVDAPGAAGVVQDFNLAGAPLPIWPGMPNPEAAEATRAALPPTLPPQTATPVPTWTRRVPTATATATPVPATATPAATVLRDTATASPTGLAPVPTATPATPAPISPGLAWLGLAALAAIGFGLFLLNRRMNAR